MNIWHRCLQDLCSILCAHLQAGRAPSLAVLNEQQLTAICLMQQADHLHDLAKRCEVADIFSLGKSVKGVEMWGLELSNRTALNEPRPHFKYIANMHGDEPSGRCAAVPPCEGTDCLSLLARPHSLLQLQ